MYNQGLQFEPAGALGAGPDEPNGTIVRATTVDDGQGGTMTVYVKDDAADVARLAAIQQEVDDLEASKEAKRVVARALKSSLLAMDSASLATEQQKIDAILMLRDAVKMIEEQHWNL